MTPLTEWQNFYVIAGSSAGALIGLQFVLIALIANTPSASHAEAGQAFATPTIIHFGSVLLLAGVMTAPWRSVRPAAMLWGLEGLLGAFFVLVVLRRMRGQTAYRPELEDWLFHAVLPLIAYLALAAAAAGAFFRQRLALFGVAAAALLLLVIGIHNAWDSATYHVFVQRRGPDKR